MFWRTHPLSSNLPICMLLGSMRTEEKSVACRSGMEAVENSFLHLVMLRCEGKGEVSQRSRDRNCCSCEGCLC